MSNRRISLLVASTILALATAGCGHYPSYISSASSIKWISASEDDLVILSLPPENWAMLQKFKSAWGFAIRPQSPSQVNDDQIIAFSRLTLPRLTQFSIEGCPNVTDHGIRALTNLSTLVALSLRRVGITDQGMQTIATGFQHLTDIGIEGCHSVSAQGFFSLTNSRTITNVALAMDEFSPRQIENIIATVSNVTWWDISDPGHKLDITLLRRLGTTRNITIQVADESNLVTTITWAEHPGSAPSRQPSRPESELK